MTSDGVTMQRIIDERGLTGSEGIIFRMLYETVPHAVLGLPRDEHDSDTKRGGMKIGIAADKYSIPADIDGMNDEIAEMFEV